MVVVVVVAGGGGACSVPNTLSFLSFIHMSIQGPSTLVANQHQAFSVYTELCELIKLVNGDPSWYAEKRLLVCIHADQHFGTINEIRKAKFQDFELCSCAGSKFDTMSYLNCIYTCNLR